MAEQPRDYVIRKGGFFYRPNAQGYTASALEAGLYTLEEAIKHSHPNGPHGPRDHISYHHRSQFPALASVPARFLTPQGAAMLIEANEDLTSQNQQLVAALKSVRALVLWKFSARAIAKIDAALASQGANQ